jgi:hypothetical protein
MSAPSDLENLLLETLRERNEPQDPVALIEELARQHATAHEELRRIIWQLVGRKQLEFTKEWRLRAVPDDELVPA